MCRPSNYKTRLCQKWQQHGECSFGDRCNFAHGGEELRPCGAAPAAPAANQNIGAVSQPSSSGANASQNPGGASANAKGEQQQQQQQPQQHQQHSQQQAQQQQRDHGQRCAHRCVHAFCLASNPSHVPCLCALRVPVSECDVWACRGGRAGDNRASNSGSPWNRKTRLCTKWCNTGSCPYGDRCNFAHGSHELKRLAASSNSWPSTNSWEDEAMLQNQMQMGGVMGNMLAMMQVRSAATRNMLSHDSKILSLILALLALSAPFSARLPC